MPSNCFVTAKIPQPQAKLQGNKNSKTRTTKKIFSISSPSHGLQPGPTVQVPCALTITSIRFPYGQMVSHDLLPPKARGNRLGH